MIFLTARDATEDKIAGLTVGGDDYMSKPFSLDELIARTRAILRRTHPTKQVGPLSLADLVLDEDTHEVSRAGVEVTLSATEFKLLRYLMLNPGGSSPRPRSSTTSGSTTSAATPTSSRPTSATCARSSTRSARP